MSEWLIVVKYERSPTPVVLKRGIRTYQEAMKELQNMVDKEVITAYNPAENDKHKYESVSSVPLHTDYWLVKASKVIRYDIKCELKMKAVPKELEDMVQCPKSE
jgi:hypothetical protein